MATEDANYVLYHHLSSICSIMVRYAYAMRSKPGDSQNTIRIREESIDIFHGEQLSEHYLCDINPFGEVPVLAPLPIGERKTIPDSLKITLYMSNYYPNMIPSSRRDEINELLRELHAINYYSLTFAGRPETVNGIQDGLRQRLDGDISDRYRDAIKYKMEHMEGTRIHAIEPESVEQNRQRATKLLAKLEPHLTSSTTGWLFNFNSPCALDAHLIVFLARMKDIGRDDLVPEIWSKYSSRAMEGAEWKQVQSGSTKPPTA